LLKKPGNEIPVAIAVPLVKVPPPRRRLNCILQQLNSKSNLETSQSLLLHGEVTQGGRLTDMAINTISSRYERISHELEGE